MYYESHELYHHGIKGMHWGVRRFQNADGSLTSAGKKRYFVNTGETVSDRLKSKAKVDGQTSQDRITDVLKRGPVIVDGPMPSKRSKNPMDDLSDLAKARRKESEDRIKANVKAKAKEVIKSRVSKKYQKLQEKGDADLKKNATSLAVKAYNKSADYMNNGGIDKFNAKQQKKYGENYMKREGYVDSYMKEFNKLYSKNMDSVVSEFKSNNSNYSKAKKILEKYKDLQIKNDGPWSEKPTDPRNNTVWNEKPTDRRKRDRSNI